MRWFLSRLSISKDFISKREAGILSNMLSNNNSSVTRCSLEGWEGGGGGGGGGRRRKYMYSYLTTCIRMPKITLHVTIVIS